MTTTVYTDGACIGNPGPGGWAWAEPGGAYASGFDPQTTNQRMEINAVLEAVRSHAGPLHVVSDSTYVVHCFRDRWYEGWQRRGWKNSQKQPVANQDLWHPLIDAYLARPGEITFEWVKGHSGDAMNDVVDRLATEAARTGGGRSGDAPPDRLGEADAPRTTRAATSTAPSSSTSTTTGSSTSASLVDSGFRLVVAGHRPPELGGYDPTNPTATAVRERMGQVLAGWSAVHDDLVVLCGMGLGAEQLGAEVCVERRVPFVAVLPYPEPDRMWAAASRDRFRRLLADAAEVVTLETAPPAGKQEAGRALGRRDTWLVERADAAIVVWDGVDRGLGGLVTSLERREADLFVIDPTSL